MNFIYTVFELYQKLSPSSDNVGPSVPVAITVHSGFVESFLKSTVHVFLFPALSSICPVIVTPVVSSLYV